MEEETGVIDLGVVWGAVAMGVACPIAFAGSETVFFMEDGFNLTGDSSVCLVLTGDASIFRGESF